jgi:hypothetical protein
MTGAKFKPWIGVDLDGTLAKQNDNKSYDPEHIGEPVKPMMDRVKAWVKAGKKVKIFTARADDEVAVEKNTGEISDSIVDILLSSAASLVNVRRC